jgi:putative nucleotidyltransferase with HDIG domain
MNYIEITDQILFQIGKITDEHNIRAYVVGGYIRDKLYGKEVKDIDIVVIGRGVDFAQLVANSFNNSTIITYPKFGTALVQIGEYKIEFVGARKESYRKDSRKPMVEDGTLDDDLLRRDFTINTIAASINKDEFGKIIDIFNGIDDLNKRVIRTPRDPKITFDDDPLRIMRAMRFASQYSFTVQSDVLEAAQEMAERLEIVSAERVSDEFLKIMSSPKPSIGLRLMQDTGVMKIVLPEVANLAGVDQIQEYHHKDVFHHTMLVLDNLCTVSENLWLRMAALLHDIGKPKTKFFKDDIGWTFHSHDEVGMRMVKNIFKRMRFPFEYIKFVENLVRLHLRPMSLVDEGVTDSAVRRLMFEAGEEIDDLMLLCRADITSKNPQIVQQVLGNYENLVKKMKEIEEKDRIRNWRPPIMGEEIMSIFGLDEGPMVGIFKQAMTDAILDGIIPNNHDAALEFLTKNMNF